MLRSLSLQGASQNGMVPIEEKAGPVQEELSNLVVEEEDPEPTKSY